MVLTAVLSVLIGVSLGLLGGGGSILAVPVLVYAAGLDAKAAIATSLLVVGITALVSLVGHARDGNVEWRTGALFSATAMAGAYGGGRLALYFDGTTLLLAFAGMMVMTALAMLRRPKGQPLVPKEGMASPWLVIAEGLVVGLATGLVGAGGGFLVVPALVLLGGMDMKRAVGTSLMVIAFKSFAAFAGHAAHVQVDYSLVVIVTVFAVVGTLIGRRVGGDIKGSTLKMGFGAFVLVMAGYVVWREAGMVLGLATSLLPGMVAVVQYRRSAPSPVRALNENHDDSHAPASFLPIDQGREVA
jgi:uncharacterized membrane protein YfcA